MSDLKALIFECSLKPSPAKSSTQKLSSELAVALENEGVKTEQIRVVDHVVLPGVETDMGEGDEWPALRTKMLASDIVIIATPTWAGQHSSVAQRVIERLDAELSETDDRGLPSVYDKVGGAVVVGNEDGAHHISAIIFQALNDFGFTIPPASATYWNGEAMGGTDYKDLKATPESVDSTTKQMAKNLVHAATLLKQHPYNAV